MLVFSARVNAAGERIVDVYTQRGGVGPNATGGEFAAGEQVILTAIATYNNFSVQHVAVAFQVLNPDNGTEAILSALTDENGTARTDFRIPHLPQSEGVWTVIASVDISSQTASDTVSFTVLLLQIVGGYAFPMKMTNAEKPLPLYLTLLTISATLLSAAKRRSLRRTEH